MKKGRAELRAKAAAAVKEASGMKPLVFKGSLKFEAVFRTEELAKKYNTWNFHRTGAFVSWEAENMTDGFNKLNLLTFFPKKISMPWYLES